MMRSKNVKKQREKRKYKLHLMKNEVIVTKNKRYHGSNKKSHQKKYVKATSNQAELELIYTKSPKKYSKKSLKAKKASRKNQKKSLNVNESDYVKNSSQNFDKIPPKQPAGKLGRSQIGSLKREIAKERNKLMNDLNNRLLEELRNGRSKPS